MATLQTLLAPGLICLASLAVLPACDEKDPDPSEQLQNAVDDGRQAIDNLESTGEELEDKNTELREQLAEKREAIQKTSMDQLEAYTARFETLSDRISELPAENEEAFRKRLDEIQSTSKDLKSRLAQYMENNGGQEAWEDIKEAMSDLKAKFDGFVSDLDSELQE